MLTHVDGVSVHDNDMYDYEYQNTLLNFSLTVNHGVLGLRSMEGLGGIIFLEDIHTNDYFKKESLHFLASLRDVNIAFQDLIYIGNKNFYGTDTLKIIVNDLGNFGSGGRKTDEREITLNVKNVNDHPQISMPEYIVEMSEDTEIILKDIFVTDTDLRYSDDNDVLRMEISVDMGCTP